MNGLRFLWPVALTARDMTKLCIITHSYPRFDGDWRSNFIESLAKAYVHQDVEVTIFVPYTKTGDRKTGKFDKIRIVTYKYLPFKAWHTIGYGHSMGSDLTINLQDLLLMPFLLLVGMIRFTLLLRKEHFDLIQAHWAVPNTVIAVFGRFFARSQAKIFTSFPGSDVTAISAFGCMEGMLTNIISRSDYLSCNSSDLKNALIKAGFDARRIDLVIYGVDEGIITFSADDRAAIRRTWCVHEGDIVLLMIGRFVPQKGFSTALRALRHITSKRKNVRLMVVGNGSLKSEYDTILMNDGTGSYVQFVGEIPTQELKRYYSACDIFLMPSRRLPADGLNVVVPEAMSCGRAIVASRVGGNDLVVFHGVNGFLHEENDHGQLSELVLKLADDPEMRREMGTRSLWLIRERFSWDVIAKHYLKEFYDRQKKIP